MSSPLLSECSNALPLKEGEVVVELVWSGLVLFGLVWSGLVWSDLASSGLE